MVEIKKEVSSCDCLIVGGGIAGLMAAISAADQGAKVIIAEKANTLRSGSGATGNDHFRCYIPEVHGPSAKKFLKEFQSGSQTGSGGFYDVPLQMQWVERTFECVKSWQEWGINMQPHGGWEFAGHAMPGKQSQALKYDGGNQKEVMTQQALKRGVKIVNHMPIVEFLSNDEKQIIGAIGLDISSDEPALTLIRTKSIVSATGGTNRLYPSVTAGWLFNVAYCPAAVGGGRAAAYRAGAKLVNLEMPYVHAGPKYFERCGKGTWIGVLSDVNSQPVGPFVTKPSREYGDITGDLWKDVFTDKLKDGTGPVYMDCSKTSPEDIEYMIENFAYEGDTSIPDIMEKQGLKFENDMVEFIKYNPILMGRGIQIDEHAMTNVQGLFAAGDELGNFRADVSGAAVYGRIAGENAGTYALTAESADTLLDHPRVKELQAFCTELMSREEGASWKELNLAVQQILNDHCGIVNPRSESILSAGLNYLKNVEAYGKKTIACHNAHELMRTLETFDLALIGQLICVAALERKESRGLHKRSDYTFTNPLLEGQFITLEKGRDGEPKTAWRKRVELETAE
ncbi:MAG: FAD-binding protein [Peptococcaceae bacterium]|nr:FAD-binding protein [Peptococcaceae bacterium]